MEVHELTEKERDKLIETMFDFYYREKFNEQCYLK